MLGGGRSLLVHDPHSHERSDEEDKQFKGIPEFYKTWPKSDVLDWPGPDPAELGKEVNEGGVWTGVESGSADSFPFVGPVPGRDGHFVAAGFVGHGMPRILLSTAHITPMVLGDLGVEHAAPALVAPYPQLPKPFVVTAERVEALQTVDTQAKYDASIKANEESAKKPFCNDARSLLGKTVV